MCIKMVTLKLNSFREWPITIGVKAQNVTLGKWYLNTTHCAYLASYLLRNAAWISILVNQFICLHTTQVAIFILRKLRLGSSYDRASSPIEKQDTQRFRIKLPNSF